MSLRGIELLAELSRREFMRLASLMASAAWLPACGDGGGASSADAAADAPDAADAAGDTADASSEGADGAEIEVGAELPSLGGAPDTAEGRAIAAFVDTIVPGSHRDLTGAPGALDVEAAALFFDPALPAAAVVSLLVLALDSVARAQHSGRLFVELVPADREDVVARALADSELMGYAIQLAKLAWLSAPGTGAHLGYPGPNSGYVDHPDFTFGRAMATEITEDGNLP